MEVCENCEQSSGMVSVRATKHAGAEVGIWPEEVERGHMQKLDNDAHRLIGGLIKSRGEMRLDKEQRHALLEWLFVFVIRSTAHRDICQQINQIYDQTGATRSLMLQDVLENAEVFLQDARSSDPEKYAQLVAMKGSKEEADAFLIARLTSRVLNNEIPRQSNSLFHHMLTSGVHEQQMRYISGMRWTWLRSNTDFIISDNPFCRSQRGTHNINHGFKHKDLEVTFPIGRRLTLWMHRLRKEPAFLEVRDGRVVELNRRQIEGAHAFAWGPHEGSLKPPARR